MIYNSNDVYDVFNMGLMKNADYDGYFEMPHIKTSDKLPNDVVTFSKAMSKSWENYDCWVVFYEHDKNFERTYLFCFDGIENNKTVSIGTHGCIKKKGIEHIFKKVLPGL